MFVKTRRRIYSSRSLAVRLLASLLRVAGHTRRFLLNSRWRSEVLTRLLHPTVHLQGPSYTETDRYPELFEACRQHFANYPEPRILSFGCSTGEEVFTLGRYLPQALITGVELNRWCLRKAIAASPAGARHVFLHPLSEEFRRSPPFDAIFCMAVLQRTENRTRTQSKAHPSFPFTRFEQTLGELDGKLKPGGLLFLDETDFSFFDASVAAGYRALDFPGSRVVSDRPLFGPDNRLRGMESLRDRCFQKLS